ncbi:MAG: transcription elongation factor S-II [Benjaminiella poitrasii]|nr:MAG: transcription elongation factor S-II [Benjaminiella poitrasii]
MSYKEPIDTILVIRSYIKRAKKLNNIQELLNVLERLHKVKITVPLLRKSGIARTVKRLKELNNPRIARRVDRIIRKWRQEAKREKERSKRFTGLYFISSKSSSSNLSIYSMSSASSDTTLSEYSNDEKQRTIQTDNISFLSTRSSARDRAIELLYSSIGIDSLADSEILLHRAIEIEMKIYEMHNETINDKYKSKVRALALNLKNKNNPNLREKVIIGKIAIDSLITMSIQNMASEELKARNKKLADEALFNSRGMIISESQAETDAFLCKKCNQRKCTYFQIQTRAADESTTVYVQCVICFYRWKVSIFHINMF